MTDTCRWPGIPSSGRWPPAPPPPPPPPPTLRYRLGFVRPPPQRPSSQFEFISYLHRNENDAGVLLQLHEWTSHAELSCVQRHDVDSNAGGTNNSFYKYGATIGCDKIRFISDKSS